MAVSVAPECFLLWSLIILLLPMGWWGAAAFAAAFHELCHAVAVLAFHGKITGITLQTGGIRMETTALSPRAALVSGLAGPIGELFLLLFAPHFPRLALCALIQGVFNLLPLLPLDGGRAMQTLLSVYLNEEQADKVFRWIENGTAGLLLLAIIILFFRIASKILLLLPLYLLLRWYQGRNSPCQESNLGLQ